MHIFSSTVYCLSHFNCQFFASPTKKIFLKKDTENWFSIQKLETLAFIKLLTSGHLEQHSEELCNRWNPGCCIHQILFSNWKRRYEKCHLVLSKIDRLANTFYFEYICKLCVGNEIMFQNWQGVLIENCQK